MQVMQTVVGEGAASTATNAALIESAVGTAGYGASSASAAAAAPNYATYAQVAATGLSAYAQLAGGRAQSKAADYEAEQLRVAAGQQRASAQRAAVEERRQTTLALSRLRAVAGGGSGDASVVDAAEDIAGAGEYSALTALYQGEDRARSMETAAGLRRFEGGQARAGGYIGAVSSVLSGGGTLYERRRRKGYG